MLHVTPTPPLVLVSQTMAVLAKLDTPVMQILARLALPALLVNTRVPAQMATVPPVTRTVLAVLVKPNLVS